MSELSVGEEITFEEAIALAQSLLSEMERGELAEPELEARIGALVGSENGARGFFVTYLTDDRALADSPSPAVVRALQSSPEIVSELLVKNLAMSAGMAVAHRRNQNEEMAKSSERVRSRSAALIRDTELSAARSKAKQLLESVSSGEGAYQSFLKRWGYDSEQLEAIASAAQPVAID